jgi:hypothetical protein
VTGRRAARGRAGFGLLEAVLALVVVAVGVTALQRLVTRSVSTLGEDPRLGRAMLGARSVLTDAVLDPPEPGTTSGTTSDGLRFEREVRRTPHPALREVRVRVWPDAGAAPCELWEVIGVPPA